LALGRRGAIVFVGILNFVIDSDYSKLEVNFFYIDVHGLHRKKSLRN
jgi:hypothetical protein